MVVHDRCYRPLGIRALREVIQLDEERFSIEHDILTLVSLCKYGDDVNFGRPWVHLSKYRHDVDLGVRVVPFFKDRDY